MTGAFSIVPDLIDALVDQATEKLPDVHVWDGYPVTSNVGDLVLMVGIDDPESDVAANGAHSAQSYPHAGRSALDEDGEITLAASAWNGDGDPRAARRAAYALVNAVVRMLHDDPTVGLASVHRTGVGDSELLQNQDGKGATATVVFKVAFSARIWAVPTT